MEPMTMHRAQGASRESRNPRERTALTAVALGALVLTSAAAGAVAQPADAKAGSARSLVGTVVSSDGRPVPGARVLATAAASRRAGDRRASPSDRTLTESLTGPDGAFRIDAVGEGRHVLLVTHAEFATALREGVVAERPASIVLERGSSVTGQVHDALTGRPLSGVDVELRPAGAVGPAGSPFARAARHVAKTDDAGAFLIDRLEKGFYDVAAVADGFARATLRNVSVSGNGPSSPPANLYLAEGVVLRGRVVDEDGAAVAGAAVSASPGRVGPEFFRHRRAVAGALSRDPHRTDEDGSFVIEGLPPLSELVLEVRHEGFAPAWREVEATESAGVLEPVTMRLSPGGSVTGRLMLDDETPFTGEIEAEVVLESGAVQSFQARPRLVRREAGEVRIAGGAFHVDRLPHGEVTLLLRPSGSSALRRQSVLIASGEVTDLGVLLFEGGPSIAGTVTNDLGETVAGARVAVAASSRGRRDRKVATTDARGRFVVGGLADDETYRVTAASEGLAELTIDDVEPGGDPVSAVLRRRGRVSARVVAGEPAAPVSGVRVTSYVKETSERRQAPRWRARDAERDEPFLSRSGAFTMELVPGTYTLKIASDGFVPARLEDVTVAPGEELQLGDVLLDRGTPLDGVVSDAVSGAPLPGAFVTLEGDGPGRMRGGPGGRSAAAAAAAVVTDPAGRFSFAGLPPGVHGLRVEAGGFATRTVDVAIEAGVPAGTMQIEMTRGGWIEGYVRDKETGEVIPGAFVTARSGFGPGSGSATATDETGYYLLENLPPGTYRVSTMPQTARGGDGFGARMERMQTETAKVRDDRATVVDFPPGAGTIFVSGAVLKGTEPVAARLIFSESGSQGFMGSGFASASSDDSGSYEVTLARPGHYDVRVMPRVTDDRRSVSFRRSFNLSVEVREGVDRLDLEVGENSLSGRSTNIDSGEPLGGVTIVAHRIGEDGASLSPDRPDAMTMTEEDGSFTVDGLATGEYRVWFMVRGHLVESAEEIDVDQDDRVEDLDVVMTPFAPVEVAVADLSGVPVEGARVMPLQIESLSLAYQLSGITDVDGRAELDALPRGSQQVGIAARGYAPLVIDVDPGDPEAPTARAELTRGQPVRVVVVDAEEAPLEGVRITIAEDRGADLTRLIRQVQRRRGAALETGEDGRVLVPNLEPGRYVFGAVHDGREESDTIEVRAGEDTEVELTLR